MNLQDYRKADETKPIPIPLINAELELLREFFETWESFHETANSPTTKAKKEMAAQLLVEAAQRVRNYRNPLSNG